MSDNRSLWSDGPSEDEHHGWLDPEHDRTGADAAGRPAAAGEPTRPHSTGRLTPREDAPASTEVRSAPSGPARPPRQGPSAWEEFRGRMIWPLVALCAVVLIAAGIAIGTRLIGERTVERTVVAGNSGGATSSQLKAAYEATHDGVVYIRAGDASGTGWVYDDKGTIVTNNHVIADSPSNVQVRFKDDGKMIDARVLGTDVSSDLAVLRVNPDDVQKLVPLKLAESDDVQTGDPVIAIGYPLGLDQTTTAGIVSGVGRQIPAQNSFQIDKVIQTDAPVNQGNSGGPLVNTKGQVVGVNSQIATAGQGNTGNIGIAYAIPSDTVRDAVPTLEKGGKVPHAFLGVRVGDTRKDDGVLVGGVTPNSPAERANLQANSLAAQAGQIAPDGDVVLKIDGESLTQSSDLTRIVNQHKPGDRITLEIERDGKTRDVKITLADRPSGGTASSGTVPIPTNPSSPSTPGGP